MLISIGRYRAYANSLDSLINTSLLINYRKNDTSSKFFIVLRKTQAPIFECLVTRECHYLKGLKGLGGVALLEEVCH